MATKTKETSKKAASKAVKVQSSSPYGATVELICQNSDATKAQIIEQLKSIGIEYENHKNAINTGIGQARKIINLLKANGWVNS